jgi:LysR family cys regulon transcriptional activator
MNFNQLKFVREASRQEFNLTDVANAVFVTQSGVSRKIKELEDELGVEIFQRRGKRLTGLTEPGRQLLPVVERILLDAENLRRMAEQFAREDVGRLDVATTHTQARYALVPIVKTFRARFPKVHLALHQGNPNQVADMVAEGEADVAIATEALDAHTALVTFPGYRWRHCVIVPAGHELEHASTLTLDMLAEYPIVTYDSAFTGRSHIDKAFAAAGLTPDVVITAMDADVIKTYVDAGFGIGVVASMAFDPARDQHLRKLESDHLFEANTTKLGVRKGAYLRNFALEFIHLFTPELDRNKVQATLRKFLANGES